MRGQRNARIDRRAFLGLSRGALLAALAGGSGLSPACARPTPSRPPAPGPANAAGAANAGKADARVNLLLTGDVMLGRGVDQVLPHAGDPVLRERHIQSAASYVALAERANGPIPRPVPFAYVWGDALAEMDRAAPELRIVNLETSVTRSGAWEEKGIHYRMHPDNVPCLTAAEIDACVLANNHVLDFGRAGLLETLDALRSANLRTVGAGRDVGEAQAPVIFALEGGRRLILFAFGATSSGIPRDWAAGRRTPGVNLLDATAPQQIAASVEQLRRPGDVVVASLHWGGNWGYAVPSYQRSLAHRLVDEAGVDVVHGHSSHHPKGIEVHRGRLILYGCGDLLNDYEGIGGRERFRSELALLYFVTLDFTTGALVRLEMTPLRIARFRLGRTASSDARWLRDRLDRESAPLGARVGLRADGWLELGW